MFGIIAMGNCHDVPAFFRNPTSGLKNIEQAMRSNGRIDARFADLSSDGNARGAIFLDIHGDSRIFYEMGLANVVLNLPSGLTAGLSGHRHVAGQRQQDTAVAFHSGVGGKIRGPVDSNV